MNSQNNKIKCPKCSASRYIEQGTVGTLISWPLIYENGKLISKDPNIYTTSCECLACGQEFDIVRKEGQDPKIVIREN